MKNKVYEDFVKEKTNKRIDDVNKQFEQGLIDDEEHLFKLEHLNRLKNESDFIKRLDDIYFFAYKKHLAGFFLCDILEKIKDKTFASSFINEDEKCSYLSDVNKIFDEVFNVWTNETDLKMMGF